jgi:tight adherence protein C
MTWPVAVSYVGAGALLVAGLAIRSDPRVLGRLGAARPEGTRDVLGGLGRRLPDGLRRGTAARLSAIGADPGTADRVLGARVGVAAAGIVVGASALPGSGPAALLAPIALAAGGFVLPGFVLARRAAAALEDARGRIPDLLDRLSVAVSAGMGVRPALDLAAEGTAGRLGAELDRARREVTLGRSWREALRAAGERSGLRELVRLATTLERSARLGDPVAARLRALARDVRHERRAAAEERARRAPVLMLFPLVFLILPAFVLAAVVPAVLVALGGVG